MSTIGMRVGLSSSSVLMRSTSTFSVEEEDEAIGAKEEDRHILLSNADGIEEEDKAVDTNEEYRLIHLVGAMEEDKTKDD